MSDSLSVINLKCSGCGAPLEIASDMEEFSCGYCSAAQRVVRRGGTVALNLIAGAVAKVQAGTDKVAAELAIQRLKGDLTASEALRQSSIGYAMARAQFGTLAAKIGLFFLFVGGAMCIIGGVRIGLAEIAFGLCCLGFFASKQSELFQAIAKINQEHAARAELMTKEIAENSAKITCNLA